MVERQESATALLARIGFHDSRRVARLLESPVLAGLCLLYTSRCV